MVSEYGNNFIIGLFFLANNDLEIINSNRRHYDSKGKYSLTKKQRR